MTFNNGCLLLGTHLCSLIPATINEVLSFFCCIFKISEVKTDHKYLPKFTCLVNKVEVSNPALVLKCLLPRFQSNAGSLKRKYVQHGDFAILECFTFAKGYLASICPNRFSCRNC